MITFIILFAIYILFWITTFVFIQRYIQKLVDGLRGEVMSIANLAKDYLKK